MAVLLYPKEFIQASFKEQIKEIVYEHGFYYISFGLICAGIEFLGKCMAEDQGWHTPGKSEQNFKKAIDVLMPEYTAYKDDLYSELRCGFAHAFMPGQSIGLTHRKEAAHYGVIHLEKGHTLNLIVEDFYDAFEAACDQIIAMDFSKEDKMNQPLLKVPNELY